MARAGLHLTVSCALCGTSFRQSKIGHIYCSKKCGARAWRAAKPKIAPEVVVCLNCGTQFTKTVETVNKKYCSTKCREMARPRVTTGAGKHWSRGKEYVARKTCEVCSRPFYAPPVLVRRKGGRFCSVSCRSSHFSQIPSSFPSHGRGKTGKRTDLDDRFFRSRWEANWARYLNWLLANKQIKAWEYECETFEFPVKRGSRFYTPDFKITELGGTTYFQEVKGYMDQRSATKLRRMSKYYPKVEVRLIDKLAYRSMAKQMRRALPFWEGSTK